MTEKPKPNVRLYRPAFIKEREIKEIELDAGMRTCIGYKEDGSVCGAELPRGLRYYCSGSCMLAAKARGEYRHD